MISKLPIIKNHRIKGRFYRLILESKEMASNSKPGQFLHIQVIDSIQPLLRRPFSIYRVNAFYIEILYEVIGVGTRILSERKANETINCHGPLGNSFSEDLSGKKAMLVGGGIGIAPLLFFGEKLLAQNNEVNVILGYRSAEDVVGEEDFNRAGLKAEIITNDGSYGRKGFVTQLLEEKLDESYKVFTCGPIPMLEAVHKVCESKNVDCEASIHNFMGCGFGACLGCVFPTKKGYKRVCKDGPVFDSKELIFQ